MNWNEMHEALEEAKETLKLSDMFMQQMADIVVDRLESGRIGRYTLCKMKTKLRKFNMHTYDWK